ncbi:Bax inhibitor-1 family protein [uncultured Parolsenella sp.]|uniref:Bax inhibitor-1/YccA family protein n=1 Tax=uncultured Parolsenella sp. TaxID=2083008 RepID=UPI0027D94ABF|nr:Bax inhibitor-1 family protein [uncultured Parolsenella sp.]
MAGDQFGNQAGGGIEPYSPFVEQRQREQASGGRPLSLRAYSLTLTGLVLAGFLVMGFCASLFGNVGFLMNVVYNYMLYTIVSFVASIAGIVMMGRALKSKSVALSLAGYALFVASFGFTASLALLGYDMQTISTAFLATAGIVVVFACLGVAFPAVFQRAVGVLSVALLALILVQVVMLFMGVDQTWVDFAVIVVFCGFIGYDFHQAMYMEPTLVNAVFAASNLFLDIINVFLRVLAIFGRRD